MMKPAPARVLIDLAPGQARPDLPDKRLLRLPIEWREDARPFAERCAAVLGETAGALILLLDGATLADPRLHRTLAERAASTAVESRDAASVRRPVGPARLCDAVVDHPSSLGGGSRLCSEPSPCALPERQMVRRCAARNS